MARYQLHEAGSTAPLHSLSKLVMCEDACMKQAHVTLLPAGMRTAVSTFIIAPVPSGALLQLTQQLTSQSCPNPSHTC